jgi:arylsulfatase A-like enzyme
MTSKLSLGLVILPFVPSSILQGQEQEVCNERPNIIFIMSDDHARQAMSIYGHPIGKVAPTPNIDRIGHEGAVFQNNYCCNSISGPSRAAILTGKHSHKNGFMKNWAKGFDGTQQTLPKILQANGYETAVIGKWHLISKPTGFDHWMILDDQGEYCNPHFITENDTTRHLGYVTDLITKYTEEWLDGRKDKNKPFFLMMHHKAVHRNWVPAERHYHLYEHTTFPLPDNYFDVYEGRYAAQMQKMNIYCDMYEGHDLKMVTGMDSDSSTLGRMLFWGQWSRMNAAAFLMHTVIEIMNSTPENVHSKKSRNGNTSVTCKIIWEL